MKLTFRALMLAGLILEIALLIFISTTPDAPAWWLLTPLMLFIAALVLLAGGMWRDYVRYERSWATSLTFTSRRFGVPRRVLSVLVSEVGFLVSSLRFFFAPQPDPQSQVHTGHKNLRTVVYMLLGLIVVEMIIVHLAISNDFWRYLILIISIYALLLLVGFYVSVRDTPHLITAQGIVLRHSNRLTCEIPWSHVQSVKSTGAGEGGDISIDANGLLRIPVLSEVNVKVEVEPPIVVEDLHKGHFEASTIEFYTDDKQSFLTNSAAKLPNETR